MELEDHIRALVTEHFFLGNDGELSSDQSLLGTGVLDSTGVLELVALLEQHCHVEIADSDLVPENLDTLTNIVRFVRGKQAQRGAA